MELLSLYQRALVRHGVDPDAIARLDLDNSFYWLFRLSELIAKAYVTFDGINAKYFANKFARPHICFCTRATGGYYDRRKHEIGISLAMTIEHGESEFTETLLHEIAHIVHHAHSQAFYDVLSKIGGSGRKAPMTVLLKAKRASYVERNYPIRVRCPNCQREHRYKTRRALKYACKPCCQQYAGGKFDARFQFVISSPLPEGEGLGVRATQ
jgi:predicted SprT family Zn-dependent metalloprotease